jgi:hypothetical protein
MESKTAVEWLHEIAKQREPDKFDWKQANKLYKEQIINAYVKGYIESELINKGAEYYNKTFKK